MKKLKIKILKDHEASTDGIRAQSYKKGEILELGSPRLNMHLYEWYSRNAGFSEAFIEIEKKVIPNAPENKQAESDNKENQEREEDKEEKDEEITESNKNKFFKNKNKNKK